MEQESDSENEPIEGEFIYMYIQQAITCTFWYIGNQEQQDDEKSHQGIDGTEGDMITSPLTISVAICLPNSEYSINIVIKLHVESREDERDQEDASTEGIKLKNWIRIIHHTFI